MKRVLGIVICAFVTCGSAWAQTVAVAQISGTVKDPSGAVLPGVEIKVTQTETGVNRTTITAEAGSYTLPNLAVGPYRFAAMGHVDRRQCQHRRIPWRVNLGVTDRLPPDKQNTGRPSSGGSIATASGLIFIGATDDSRFRAFDAKTGKELWTVKLGASAHATPITYLGKNGKQYVVITSAAGGFLDSALTDDSITAFMLP